MAKSTLGRNLRGVKIVGKPPARVHPVLNISVFRLGRNSSVLGVLAGLQ
ncbi:rCG33334 [Rattus norvegicus]|uniref:RCG33334 n=1 Tax=Rattus norvegicus TaxID=10116 RepID=A6HFC3_RAT|nr:rCG33334 [Rattus norvegicus]